jgi:hypothetical protein
VKLKKFSSTFAPQASVGYYSAAELRAPLSIKGHRTTEALNYSHSQRSEVATSMDSSSLNLTAQMIQNTKFAMNY